MSEGGFAGFRTCITRYNRDTHKKPSEEPA
jgi:hypothetical protein